MTWLHRYSILVALCAVLVVICGVLVAGALPSSDAAAVKPQVAGDVVARLHRIAGEALTVLVLILAIRLTTADARRGVGIFGWITFAVVVGEGLLSLQPGPPGGLHHAFLAQITFAMLSAIVILTSAGWSRGPEHVTDEHWPSMRSLAVITTTLVVMQVSLGALFRYGFIGLLWHIAGAILVMLMNLFIGVCAMQQFATHSTIRPAAITMLVFTSVQVFLGMVVISMGGSKILQNSPAALISAVLHVSNGALTLAATLALAMQIRRNVLPKAAVA